MANPYRHKFSGAPYYDDFDPKKNYVKALYNPGYALQARELTQTQTYLQNQLSSASSYLFKDGTTVEGGKISYSSKQPCLRIGSYDEDGAKIKFNELIGKEFKGTTSNQIIKVTGYYVDESNKSSIKNYILFSYMGSNIKEGETFKTFKEANKRSFISLEKGLSNALVASCTEGTIFVDGYYIYIPKGNIIISPIFDEQKEYHIGFRIDRNLITAKEDSTLHDPAAGTYNFKAPGADRYQINAILTAYDVNNLPKKDNKEEVNYVTGIIIKGDTLIKDQDSGMNSDLLDLLAKRTYEESGSYTINPWKIQLKEHPTDDSKYIVSIEAGSGYIYGYRVSTLVSQELEVKKPRTYLTKEKNITYVPDSCYTYAKFESNSNSELFTRLALQATYFPSFLTYETVSIHDGYNGKGKEIGKCRITDVFKQGNYFRIYLTETNDILGKFSSARSIVSTSKPNQFVNLLINEDGYAEFFGTDNPKIIPTGYSMVTPTVKSIDGVTQSNPIDGSISYQFIKTYSTIASKTTKTSITFNTNQDGYEFDSNGLLFIYEASSGKHVDITNLIVNVTSNSVTISNQNDSNIFKEGVEYIVCGRVSVSSGSIRYKYITEYTEVVNVKKDVDTIQLQKEDIIELKSVMMNGIDYKDILLLDNGQTDYIYDYGKISGFKQINQNSDSNTFTITYRYFEHGSVAGPFSAGSYNNNKNITYQSADNNKDFKEKYPDLYSAIPVYRSKSTGTRYKLRDCLDYRVKSSELTTRGISYFPTARSKMVFNCGIYLPRIDSVWVDKAGNFGITTGIPSQNPEIPEEKDGTMTIYHLYNNAYVNGIEDVSVQYVNNQRHTMKDITNLENRLQNVENVVSLNLLEQSAVNMQITDESGLNRFKTGIFTDGFGDFSRSDYTNPEWDCTIDSVECSLRPLFDCKEVGFNFVESTSDDSTLNVEKNDIILTKKPIGTEVYAKNTALSEQTNIQSLMFYVWNGALKLNPSIDTWVNDLGQFVVSEKYVETPKPPTTYRTWSNTYITGFKNSSYSYNTSNRRVVDRWGSYWNDTYRNTVTTTTATTETKTTTETTSYNGSWKTSDEYTHMESQDTYMRERKVEYKLSGMRPGMKIKGTMDGIELKLSDDKIKSDGTLIGTFKVPEKMTVGTKLVEFFDSELTSAASTEYSANGKTVWTNIDRTYIRTWTSVVSTDVSYSHGTQHVGTSTTKTKVRSVYRDLDPISESFYIDNKNGIMLESIDIYFAKKDNNVNVELFIVECENGYPSQTMVPFSRVTLTPKQVNVTPITEVNKNKYPTATKFKFESPLYLAPDTEYAFIIIAPSYNYEIYTSTLGKADLISGIGIREQPYIGSMFKSQNLRTWTAEQLSDITFKINKYVFDINQKSNALFNINPTKEEFKCAMETIAINSYVPNKTNVEYYYKWKNGSSWIQFNNKEDIFNTEIKKLENEENSFTGPSLQLLLKLITEDKNISPMIDLEQVYGIFTNNIVKKSDDENYTYKCGTYISNSISLENPSDDIRVILDAILPNESGINVSFKTASYKPIYVKQAASGFFLDQNNVKNNIGNTMQIYYYNKSTETFDLPENTPQSLCVISGYKNKNVYLKSVSSPNDFFDISEFDSTEENYPLLNNENISAICLLPILSKKPIKCPKWTAKVFHIGDYVLYDGSMWKAKIETISENIPSELSIVWEKIEGIKTTSVVKTDNEVVWRKMKKKSKNITTEIGDKFIEYTYIPETEISSDFTDFTIRIDMYSQDEINVPRVKNLRAIAVI